MDQFMPRVNFVMVLFCLSFLCAIEHSLIYEEIGELH